MANKNNGQAVSEVRVRRLLEEINQKMDHVIFLLRERDPKIFFEDFLFARNENLDSHEDCEKQKD